MYCIVGGSHPAEVDYGSEKLEGFASPSLTGPQQPRFYHQLRSHCPLPVWEQGEPHTLSVCLQNRSDVQNVKARGENAAVCRNLS